MRSLSRHTPGEWEVCFSAQQTLWFARLCAVRKSPTVAERAKQKLLRDATRKGKTVQSLTLEAAEYLFVLTTLPRAEATAEQVLELHRARWQIERCFFPPGDSTSQRRSRWREFIEASDAVRLSPVQAGRG